jgi:hypothetical protein
VDILDRHRHVQPFVGEVQDHRVLAVEEIHILDGTDVIKIDLFTFMYLSVNSS